jgi:hypothetical protein
MDATAPEPGVARGGSIAASGVSSTAASARLTPIVARGSRSPRWRFSTIGPAA